MKAYTDLKQSKQLAEILQIESADMWYEDVGLMIPRLGHIPKEHTNTETPCWSLAALLNIIPGGQVNRMAFSNKWEAASWNDSDFEPAYYVEDYDNPVDACVEMILKLHELKLM